MAHPRITVFAGLSSLTAMAVVLAVIGVSGCTALRGTGPASSPEAAPAATATPSEHGAPSQARDGHSIETDELGIDPANPLRPIAPGHTVETTPLLDHDPATVKVDIVKLQRRGRLAYAVFAVQPHSASARSRSVESWLDDYRLSPSLVDSNNLMRYRPVSEETYKVEGGIRGSVQAGQTAYLYVVFAAPPADVADVDVHLSTTVPPFLKVPLS